MAESTYNLTIKFSSASFVKDESICYVDIDDKQYELGHGDTLPDIPAESTVSLSLDAPLKSRHKLPYYTNSANDDIDEVEFDDYCAFTITKDTTVTLYATTYDTPYISFSEIEEESFTFTINDIDDKDRYLDYDIIDQDGKIIVSDYDINVRYDDSYSQTINNLNPNSIYIIYFSVYDANGSNEYGTYYTGGDEVSTKEAPKPTVSISEITATTAKVTLTSEGSYFVSAVIKVAPKGYTESKTVTLGSLGTSKTITITQLQPASDYTVYVLLYNSSNAEKGTTTADFETEMIDLPILEVNYKNGTTELTTPFSVNLWIENRHDAIDSAKLSINALGVPDQEIEIPGTDTIGPFTFENLNYGTNYTITAKYKGEYLEDSSILTNSISFQTLNAYTINVKLNNLNHIYIETKDMEDVYISHGETFLVIPGETFTVSFPNDSEGKSAFTNYDQTHDEGKKATYYWPYGFPIKAEGIGDTETSRIPGDQGEASYLVGTAETENGKTYTFTAYPSGWTGWTDSEKPKAKEKTTTFSVESWNKLVNCLDAWNAFCGKSAVKDTFMPQGGSYNFTATIYNKIYDELTGLFNISSSYPIMNRVEIGKERQTPVSASGLINIGNNIKYDYLKSNHK